MNQIHLFANCDLRTAAETVQVSVQQGQTADCALCWKDGGLH